MNKFSKLRNLKFDRSNDQVFDNEFLTVIWTQFEFKISDERSTVQKIKFYITSTRIEFSTVIWIQFEFKISDEARQMALRYVNINKNGRGQWIGLRPWWANKLY